MKNHKQWFELLPEPYKTQALINMEHPDKKDTSAHEALKGDFTWIVSPESHIYWEDVYHKLKSGSLKLTDQAPEKSKKEQFNAVIDEAIEKLEKLKMT